MSARNTVSMGDSKERPLPVWILALMLLVSGGCALVYQVVWVRELRLVFGATTASSAAVLAIFMGGLGLGNGLLGKRIDGSPRPLRFYGRLEAGIALSVAMTPWLIDITRHVYVELGGQSSLGGMLATAIRLAAATLILAVPTFLLGGTMPAAARAVADDGDRERRSVAVLYGINTLGAVLGAAAANFYWLEIFGNRSTLWSACVLNLMLAAGALALSVKLARQTPSSSTRKRKTIERKSIHVDSPIDESQRIGWVCGTSAIVGFVFFLMEIVWYRMFGSLLGGTTYTFGLILCIALFGIGMGGAIYAMLARRLTPSFPLLAITCALEALLIAIPFWFGDRIAMWVLYQQYEPIASFAEQIGNWLEVGAFAILPPSLIAGFQFPLLIAIAGAGRHNIGRHVGWTFAANTVGAICGSLAGGFVLLPILTAPGVWQLAVGLLAVLAVIIAAVARSRTRWSFGIVALGSLLAMLAIFQEGPTAAWRHSGIGAGRAMTDGTGRNADQQFIHHARRKCIWEAEGVESSVAIVADDGLSFIVNGKSDGNAYADAGTQIGLGLLGPMLHHKPHSGLVIGLGTGESAGWMADVQSMKAVDVVELEPSVTYMSRLCRTVNGQVLENPKVRLHYNDAREFLQTAKDEYDLIVSEPSNPYRAGISNLYTQEFYNSVSDRLAEDGLFLQWLQGYEVDERTVGIVLQTLRSVFPHVQVWRSMARDMLLVCSNSPFSYDLSSLSRQMNDRAIQEGFRLAWRASDLEGVLAHFVCGEKTVETLLREESYPLNTDDRNLLEYAFAKTIGQSSFSDDDLHALAIQLRDDSPLPIGQRNAEKLLQRRLAMHLYLGDAEPISNDSSPSAVIRSEAYNFYLQTDYPSAADRLQQIPIDESCPIETVIYAHALAEVGQPIPDGIQKAVEKNNPVEGAAIRAIAHHRSGDDQQAVEQIVNTLTRMRTNSWAMARILDVVMEIAADFDGQAAAMIHAQLEEPFAIYRLEQKRLMLRYVLSETMGEQQQLEALGALEPFVPWTEWLLRDRAKLYAAVGHPLRQQAVRDSARYRRWAKSE